MTNFRDIIVIGTSAGGLEALQILVQHLDPKLPASIFIVNHMSPDSPGILPEILNRKSTIRVEAAANKKPIERNRIYTAIVDHHLMIDKHMMYTPMGPTENNTRPAIDPLFRSAAVFHTWRVIGIVLTGMLDDGTSGLIAIKQCGGLVVVQQPKDALYPDMCLSALEHVAVDHCAALTEISPLLKTLVKTGQSVNIKVPAELREEVKFSMGKIEEITEKNRSGELVPLTCPSCGGPLWKTHSEQFTRYRCYTGHHFTEKAMLAAMNEETENSLWFSLQMLKGRMRLLEQMAIDQKKKNHPHSEQISLSRIAEIKEHARNLEKLMISIKSSLE